MSYSSGIVPTPKVSLNGRLVQLVDELVQQGVTLEQARREFEKQFIVASIRSNNGNLCRSARCLGVHRNTLRNKVSNLGIAVGEVSSRSSSRRFHARSAAVKP
jgi:DNA-binding NtrC family response regulator